MTQHDEPMPGYVCADCGNRFLQPPKCTTCGAEKLYDYTVRQTQQDNFRLRAQLAGVVEQAALILDWRHDMYQAMALRCGFDTSHPFYEADHYAQEDAAAIRALANDLAGARK